LWRGTIARYTFRIEATRMPFVRVSPIVCSAVTALLALTFALPGVAATDALHQVDPMIGTGGNGHTFPGATVPFGMI
jgi:putative alpha-1,2-mannosidase